MLNLLTENALLRTIMLLLVFGIVALASGAAFTMLSGRIIRRAQVRELGHPTRGQPSTGQTHLRSKEIEGAWARMAHMVEATGLNLADSNTERLSQRMREAGFASPSAPRVFTLVRLILIFLLPLGYVLLTYGAGDPPSFTKLYLVGSALALLGLMLPAIYIRAKADRRRETIINGFPDCLDLLLVCVESGLGLEAAMDRVGREMVISHPLVAQLLSITTLQLRAGATREEAFRKLSTAASVDEVRSFTTLLIQSDKLGTSISTTLRIYAAEMRERRRMRAEEKAHRLPVLLSIPLVACMLPTMIGTLMLPAAVMVARQIIPLMVGR